MVFWSGSVSLSERVPTRSESNRFFVVHGHAAERFTDVLRTKQRVGIRIRSLRVDVDESHLNCCKRVFKVLARVAVAVISKPLVFASPVGVIFWLPNVWSASTKSKDRAPH